MVIRYLGTCDTIDGLRFINSSSNNYLAAIVIHRYNLILLKEDSLLKRVTKLNSLSLGIN